MLKGFQDLAVGCYSREADGRSPKRDLSGPGAQVKACPSIPRHPVSVLL